jgi:hypothetical protein
LFTMTENPDLLRDAEVRFGPVLQIFC